MNIRFRIDNEKYLLRRGSGHTEVVVYAEGWVNVAFAQESFDHAFGTHTESVVSYEDSSLDLECVSVSVDSGDEWYYINVRDEAGFSELSDWIKTLAIDIFLKR